MTDPVDETQPGLGPQKRKLNKRALVAAILLGFTVAGAKLWPQYADIFSGLGQLWDSYAGQQQ